MSELPSIAALVRFERRLNKAMDGLESASNWALDALRVFDGDKLPLKSKASSAWETAHAAEAAIPALKMLLAEALGDVAAQLKELRGAK
jgi:hypothetical protein